MLAEWASPREASAAHKPRLIHSSAGQPVQPHWGTGKNASTWRLISLAPFLAPLQSDGSGRAAIPERLL